MPLPHLILAILDRMPELHGYGIRQVTDVASWSYPVTNPSVYPALSQLEADGLVTSRSEVAQGRQRRFYTITEAGKKELLRWLEDPESLPMGKGAWRDPVLFKIRLLDCGGLEGARVWLQEAIDHFERYVEEVADPAKLTAIFAERGVEMRKYLKLSAEFAMGQARQRVEFYRRVLEEIESDLID
jgi:DNA-binding PadR family transcriptional regulator